MRMSAPRRLVAGVDCRALVARCCVPGFAQPASRLVVDDRRGRDAPLSLAEDQQRLGANAVMLHRVGRGLGLHELLVGGQVGDVDYQPDSL
jgi:hypothetical protein